MNEKMRRKDRETTEERAYEILKNGEYGILSTIGEDGYPYGVPVNFAVEGNKIYFHCAPEGYKLECLRENPKVSFTVVGATQIVPGKFTTGYESTIAFGEMHLDLPEEERRYALRLLVNKYSSAFKEIGEKYIEKSFYRTNILRLDISHISGKCKRLSQ